MCDCISHIVFLIRYLMKWMCFDMLWCVISSSVCIILYSIDQRWHSLLSIITLRTQVDSGQYNFLLHFGDISYARGSAWVYIDHMYWHIQSCNPVFVYLHGSVWWWVHLPTYSSCLWLVYMYVLKETCCLCVMSGVGAVLPSDPTVCHPYSLLGQVCSVMYLIACNVSWHYHTIVFHHHPITSHLYPWHYHFLSVPSFPLLLFDCLPVLAITVCVFLLCILMYLFIWLNKMHF